MTFEQISIGSFKSSAIVGYGLEQKFVLRFGLGQGGSIVDRHFFDG